MRGRSPSCSARPRPRNAGERRRAGRRAAAACREADEQQTLITSPRRRPPRIPPPPSCGGARRPRSRRPSSTSHDFAGRPATREEAALEETVEHVHDFDEPPAATASRATRRAGARQAANRRAAHGRGALRAPGEPLHPPDARGGTAAERRWRGGLVPRGDPRRRRRRRRPQRRQPDDGRRHRPGRFRRGQHRHAAAQPLATRPSRSISARS